MHPDEMANLSIFMPAPDDYVRARDVTCSFPGCRRRATMCDLDHRTEYSRGGETNACNLLTLCRRHHRMRHDSNWSYTRRSKTERSCGSPTGRKYIVEPDDLYLDLAAGPPTAAAAGVRRLFS